MRRDLWAAVAVTAGAAGLSALSAPAPLTAVLAVPALLACTGYVWSTVLVPPGDAGTTEQSRPLSGAQRAVASVGLSLALLVLGGLLLAALRLPLERATWLAYAAVCVVTGSLARAHREPQGLPFVLARRGRPRKPILLMALAAFIAVAAVIGSVVGARTAQQTHFTSLAFTAAGRGHAVLQVRNCESETRRYRVIVTESSGTTQTTTFSLPSGGSWQKGVSNAAGTQADLYLVDGSGTAGSLYRSVALRTTWTSP